MYVAIIYAFISFDHDLIYRNICNCYNHIIIEQSVNYISVISLKLSLRFMLQTS